MLITACWLYTGVGPNMDRQELENIASQPYADFLFEVSGYQGLSSIQYLLATRACQGEAPDCSLHSTF